VNLLASMDRKEMMPFLIVLQHSETICDLMNSNSKDIIDVKNHFLYVFEMYLTPVSSNASSLLMDSYSSSSGHPFI